MTAIYKKELRSSLHNMIAYVFVAFILLFAGIFTAYYNFIYSSAQFEYVPMNSAFIFLIAIPLVTMNVFAGERRHRTDQMLLTSRASVADIVLGKYFAQLTMLAVPTVIMSLYPLLLSAYGSVHLPAAYTSMLGFFLLGAAMIAIGTFISSLTESPVISAVISVAIFAVSYLLNGVISITEGSSAGSLILIAVVVVLIALGIRALTRNTTLSVMTGAILLGIVAVLYFAVPTLIDTIATGILNAFGLYDRLDVFISGILDLTAVFYYLSVIVLMLFFCGQTIEKRRWS